MDNLEINKAPGALKQGLRRPDKRVIIYLVCVGIATVFWLLNMLGKNYTADLDLPVRYGNLPENQVLINKLPPEADPSCQRFWFYPFAAQVEPDIFAVGFQPR